MIIDSIARFEDYAHFHPRFASVLDFLRKNDLGTLADGRYEIDGSAVFVNLGDNALRAVEVADPEVHDRYIDIQVVISGSESFGWRDRATCVAPCAEMDTTRDIQFYHDRPTTLFSLTAGQFVVFFPGDAHAPLIGEGKVRKCVFKVLMQD